jgi:hypothetical protein
MSFILFCLIFRTAYQGNEFCYLKGANLKNIFLGVFFEMMTSDMRRSRPITFSDLKDRNYTLLIPDSAFMASSLLGQIPEEEQ